MSLKSSANAPITCADWGDLADEDGFLALGRNRYHCSYVVYTDGTYFYAENGTTGELDYGGPNNIGVSGTDARAVIQAAIDAIPAGGGLIFIKNGTYNLGTNQILIYQHAVQLIGESMDDVILQYSGTAAAIYVYNSTPIEVRYCHISDIRIDAVGAAITSATATGLTMAHSSYDVVERVFVRDFQSGTAIDIRGVTGVGASIFVTIRNCLIYQCDYGVTFTGFLNANVNASRVEDTAIFGIAATTAAGVYLNQYCADNILSNVDVETYLVGFQIDGQSNRMESTRTEVTITNHIQFDANSLTNHVENHTFIGVGTYVADAGTGNEVRGCDGYVTKNRGTATIVAAATAIVVPHGCSYTPNAGDITYTLTNLPTNDIGDVYVTAIGAANFTINCRNVPGVATAVFGWCVDRTP